MSSDDRDGYDGYDVIGDVHGHAGKLVALLDAMGYREIDGAWRHRTRQAIFVGDLIDRGPAQLRTVEIARAMVDAGTATMVIGNHEFNAIAFATPDPDRAFGHLRRHTKKNIKQHIDFIAEVGHRTLLYDELIAWFGTLPLWLDLGGLRVVHACWDQKAIDSIAGVVSPTNSFTPDLVQAASRPESPEWVAVEHLLKGPEIPLAPPYLDRGGHVRHDARLRWWLPTADRLRAAALIPAGTTTPDGAPYPELADTPINPPVAPYTDEVPVIVGHYWETGTPTPLTDRVACVDYSAARRGPLVAYRWSGEATFTDENFVAAAAG